jgi:hypothetical protein
MSMIGTASETQWEGFLAVIPPVIVPNPSTGVAKEGAAAQEAVWLVDAEYATCRKKFWRPKRMTMMRPLTANAVWLKPLREVPARLDRGAMEAASYLMTDGWSLQAQVRVRVHTMTHV